MVTALDDAVGNVTQAMMTESLWNNTVFIFSTDNGGNLRAGGNNLPLRGGKFTFWDGGTRGVAFISGPLIAQTRRGSTSSGLSHACDWYATLLDVANVPRDQVHPWTAIDSHSLYAMLFSSNTTSPRTMIVHESVMGKVNGTAEKGKIRVGDWNLYIGNPGYGGYPPPGKSSKVRWVI